MRWEKSIYTGVKIYDSNPDLWLDVPILAQGLSAVFLEGLLDVFLADLPAVFLAGLDPFKKNLNRFWPSLFKYVKDIQTEFVMLIT